MAAAPSALSQTAPTSNLQASVTASVDYVDSQRSNGGDERGLVFQLRPGVTWTSRTGRLRGRVSYAADLRHDTASPGGDISHNLDAAVTAEAVENWFYVDARASVTRRPVSAFGVLATPSGSTRRSGNEEDIGTASVRPYVRGILGGVVSYNVGAFSSVTRSRNSTLGDVNEDGADFAIGSLGGGLLGWGLNGSRQRSEFLAGRATVNDRVIANVTLRPDVDWLFAVRGGRETTNIVSLDKRSYNNWGAGLRWTPSPRTLLSADVDERYFGRSWALVLEHRLALSTLRLSSTRAASTGGFGFDGGGTTVYNLFFAQFASLQPDPGLRDLLVRDFLRQAGIDPNERVRGGALSNAVAVQRRTDLSWTYAAPRLTLALQVFSGDSRTLDTLAPRLGDDRVEQRGLLASAGWRLTPTATANLSLSYEQTADNGPRLGNDLNSVALSVSEQIGPRTTASANVRLSRQSGGPDPYRETAIGAAISHRF
ncbi:MAG TPA: TIGR03016 family PEP-CTERM system-associated outer membrane protein [Rubrivivax sp.]|nr:TIGR03016 family PEP-CTERM system-associated outer membrane protein [Rubrivivax sp.]